MTLDIVLEKDGVFADGAWSRICGEGSEEIRNLLIQSWNTARDAFGKIKKKSYFGEGSEVIKKDDLKRALSLHVRLEIFMAVLLGLML